VKLRRLMAIPQSASVVVTVPGSAARTPSRPIKWRVAVPPVGVRIGHRRNSIERRWIERRHGERRDRRGIDRRRRVRSRRRTILGRWRISGRGVEIGGVRRTKPDGTQGDHSRGSSCGRTTRQHRHIAPWDRVTLPFGSVRNPSNALRQEQGAIAANELIFL
jgi:hypothetical protein